MSKFFKTLDIRFPKTGAGRNDGSILVRQRGARFSPIDAP